MHKDSDQREYDVIVWGATGVTGQLVVAYLVQTYGVEGPLRWAIAGREDVIEVDASGWARGKRKAGLRTTHSFEVR